MPFCSRMCNKIVVWCIRNGKYRCVHPCAFRTGAEAAASYYYYLLLFIIKNLSFFSLLPTKICYLVVKYSNSLFMDS